ncbi:DUF6671 family protein [Sphingomonas sp. 37zxx]|uniref:DUF6671 family protein n=1 Tax=Sphingomonas sp. 37zxx TaxID=1550073 RepID=UPI000AE9F187|nr:DUF6671 family protein [Sphingomonas sp. 37zxx]
MAIQAIAIPPGSVAAGLSVTPYAGERAILATMHAKERAIAPIAARFLGLRVEVASGIDTDAFGTFSREVPRTGSALAAARAKIDAAFAAMPDAHIALASEGSFGPHPYLPFCPLQQEIVVLVDRVAGIELVGQYATPDTNFSHAVITSIEQGLAFAQRIGFPDHGVIVMGCRDGQPAHELGLVKDAVTWPALTAAIEACLAGGGGAFVETDMRAHRNPRRMRAIRRATIDLARRGRSQCPDCRRPGFAVTERLPGLPCGWCGEPTLLARAALWSCAGCGRREERRGDADKADPGQCAECNP